MLNCILISICNAQNKFEDKDPAKKYYDLMVRSQDSLETRYFQMMGYTPSLYLANLDSLKNIESQKPDLPLKKEYLGLDLSFYDFSNLDLTGIDFSGSTLVGANFNNSKLDNVVFEDVILEGASFINSQGENLEFTRVLASAINIDSANIDNAKLSYVYIPYSQINNSKFLNSSFYKVNAGGSEIIKVIFDNVDIDSSDFASVIFDQVDFQDSKIRRSNLSNSGFSSCQFSKTEIAISIIKETLFFDCLAYDLVLIENYYGTVTSKDNYELNYLSNLEQWVDQFKRIAYGFSYRNGSVISVPNSNAIIFTNEASYGIFQQVLTDYVVSTIKSIQFWEAIDQIAKLANYTKALSQQIRRSTMNINYYSVFIDSENNVSIMNQHPANIFRSELSLKIQEKYRQRFLESNQIQPVVNENLEQNTAIENNFRQTISNDIWPSDGPPIMTLDEWRSVGFFSIIDRFNSSIYSGDADRISDYYNFNSISEMIEIIARTQDYIIYNASSTGYEINPTSFYRSPNNSLNHALGAVDISLRIDGVEDNPAEKQNMAKEISEELGSEYLVILEEIYWIEEDVTISSAPDDIRRQSSEVYQSPPNLNAPNNIQYSYAIPDSNATLRNIHTIYLNGKFIKRVWKRPRADAQHIHVQINNPEKKLPFWARKIMQGRWNFHVSDFKEGLDSTSLEKISPFFPDDLLPESSDAKESINEQPFIANLIDSGDELEINGIALSKFDSLQSYHNLIGLPSYTNDNDYSSWPYSEMYVILDSLNQIKLLSLQVKLSDDERIIEKEKTSFTIDDLKLRSISSSDSVLRASNYEVIEEEEYWYKLYKKDFDGLSIFLKIDFLFKRAEIEIKQNGDN